MKDNINTARTQVIESNQSIVSPVHVAQLLLRWWYTFTGGKRVTAKDWTVLVLCYWGSRHTMQFFMCARNTYFILFLSMGFSKDCKGGTSSNKHPILNSNGNLKYTKIEGHTLERIALRLPKGFLMFCSMLISIIMLFFPPHPLTHREKCLERTLTWTVSKKLAYWHFIKHNLALPLQLTQLSSQLEHRRISRSGGCLQVDLTNRRKLNRKGHLMLNYGVWMHHCWLF